MPKLKPWSKSNNQTAIKWYPLTHTDTDPILYWALTAPSEVQIALDGNLIELETLEDTEAAITQARDLLETLRCIKPPRPKSSKWDFVMRLGRDGDFEDCRLVRKNTYKLRPGEYPTDVLNIAPLAVYSSKGERKLMRYFHALFFNKAPSFLQMEEFILNEKNFSDYFLV